jgi:hypothetical protein
LVSVLCLLEAGDPFLGGGEGDAVAALAGFQGERDREVALAGAGRVGVVLLTLSIRCRSGCVWSVRPVICTGSSSGCSVGVPSGVRRRLSVVCSTAARGRSRRAGLICRCGWRRSGRSGWLPRRRRCDSCSPAVSLCGRVVRGGGEPPRKLEEAWMAGQLFRRSGSPWLWPIAAPTALSPHRRSGAKKGAVLGECGWSRTELGLSSVLPRPFANSAPRTMRTARQALSRARMECQSCAAT